MQRMQSVCTLKFKLLNFLPEPEFFSPGGEIPGVCTALVSLVGMENSLHIL